MMNRSKWVKEIIGKSIEEYGFKYTGCGRDGYTVGYGFERMQGDIRQMIDITIIDQKIRMMFETNAYGGKIAYGTDLIESDFLSGDRLKEFLVFKDEDEFKAILRHFREIIITKGLDLLKELSIHLTEIRPRKETHWKLYQEHEELNKKYRRKYGLEETESTQELIRRISEIILETIDEDFSQVEEMLIGLAAVYADQVIRKCGGEWKWNERSNVCLITKVRRASSVNPLNSVITYWRWRKENLDHFIRSFRNNANETVL